MYSSEGKITNTEQEKVEPPPPAYAKSNQNEEPRYIQNPNPPIIRVLIQEEPVSERNNDLGIAPALYCASCALIFLPFGWLFALGAVCWYSRINRPKTIPEERAYRFLYICIMVNFILTLFFMIYSGENM